MMPVREVGFVRGKNSGLPFEVKHLESRAMLCNNINQDDISLWWLARLRGNLEDTKSLKAIEFWNICRCRTEVEVGAEY